MLLSYLLEDIPSINVIGDKNININKLEYNSKNIGSEDVFFAIKEENGNGNDYIDEVIKKGALVIVTEDENINCSVTKVICKDIRKVMALMASKFYGNPAIKLKMIGVTGTKGKTTTTHMIRDILECAGKKVGLIGTISTTYAGKTRASEKTTPESLDLQKTLADMVEENIEYVVMEVSSHSLVYERVYGIKFIISVFTNLSPEHMDFHKDMEDYLNAKAKLFRISSFGFINADDIYSDKLIKLCECKVAKYGLNNETNITATNVTESIKGVTFNLYANKMLHTVNVNIPGRFSVYNALAAISVVSMLNIGIEPIQKALSTITVEGRSEIVNIEKEYSVIVDYAHNASSVEAILKATKKYATSRIITVFGCGGNRDKTKRPVMGEIVGKYSDFTIITSDNPRFENPIRIIKDIEVGVRKSTKLYKIEEDRKKAIAFAMKIAFRNDIILILGKGHEHYQLIKGKKFPFSDKEVVIEIAKKEEEQNV